MGRESKPYWWEAKNAFYCTINKRRYRLGKGKKNPKGRFNELMAAGGAPVTSDSVLALFKGILASSDEAFSDLVLVVWYTGCRPQEVARVEARHIHNGFWKFPKAESKGKRRERIVYLIPKAEKIVKKWVARNPEGPIFRNVDGKPWRATAFNSRFNVIQIAAG